MLSFRCILNERNSLGNVAMQWAADDALSPRDAKNLAFNLRTYVQAVRDGDVTQ